MYLLCLLEISLPGNPTALEISLHGKGSAGTCMCTCALCINQDLEVKSLYGDILRKYVSEQTSVTYIICCVYDTNGDD